MTIIKSVLGIVLFVFLVPLLALVMVIREWQGGDKN